MNDMGYARKVFGSVYSHRSDSADEMGTLEWIDKRSLEVDHSYQREGSKSKVDEMSKHWSWLACGVITVGVRPSGTMYVIDGQHRVSAAMLREEVISLPCIVFQSSGKRDEASGFLDANSKRKSMSSYDKFRAAVVAEHQKAEAVKRICRSLELEIVASAHSAGQCKCVGTLLDMAVEDEDRLHRVLGVCADICNDASAPIKESLLKSLHYIDKFVEGGLSARIATRARNIGHRRLLQSIQEAKAYHETCGARGGAIGILKEINKGVRKKWVLQETGRAK
jgi:hypothetical protein